MVPLKLVPGPSVAATDGLQNQVWLPSYIIYIPYAATDTVVQTKIK